MTLICQKDLIRQKRRGQRGGTGDSKAKEEKEEEKRGSEVSDRVNFIWESKATEYGSLTPESLKAIRISMDYSMYCSIRLGTGI